MQPLGLDDQHLLAERVARLLLGQRERVAGRDAELRDLDEEGVRAGAAVAGPRVGGDRAVDEHVAVFQLELGERARRACPCQSRALARVTVERDLAFLELELLAGARHLRVAQRQRSQPEIVGRARVERDARVAAGVHEIASRRGDAHRRQRVGRDDDRDHAAPAARGDDHVAGGSSASDRRRRRPSCRAASDARGAVLFDGDVGGRRFDDMVKCCPEPVDLLRVDLRRGRQAVYAGGRIVAVNRSRGDSRMRRRAAGGRAWQGRQPPDATPTTSSHARNDQHLHGRVAGKTRAGSIDWPRAAAFPMTMTRRWRYVERPAAISSHVMRRFRSSGWPCSAASTTERSRESKTTGSSRARRPATYCLTPTLGKLRESAAAQQAADDEQTVDGGGDDRGAAGPAPSRASARGSSSSSTPSVTRRPRGARSERPHVVGEADGRDRLVVGAVDHAREAVAGQQARGRARLHQPDGELEAAAPAQLVGRGRGHGRWIIWRPDEAAAASGARAGARRGHLRACCRRRAPPAAGRSRRGARRPPPSRRTPPWRCGAAAPAGRR